MPKARLIDWLVYFVVSAGLSLLVLFGYYGRYAGEYIDELAGIISSVNYTAPFPPLGEPGQYVGLTEYYWLQLPWAVTLAFAVWAALGISHGPRAFGAGLAGADGEDGGAVRLFRAARVRDVRAFGRDPHLPGRCVRSRRAVRLALGSRRFLGCVTPALSHAGSRRARRVVILLSSTMFVVPSASDFMIGRGDWDNPKLEHLRFRSGDGKYKRPESPDISDTEWDLVENDAANYLKTIVQPNEPILLLTANRLLHFNSDTISVGGRYHYLLYLACVGLLDREGFDELVPHEIIDDIIANPPRVIVSAYEWAPLAEVFPEFERLRETRYVKTRNFRHILIYELRDDHAATLNATRRSSSHPNASPFAEQAPHSEDDECRPEHAGAASHDVAHARWRKPAYDFFHEEQVEEVDRVGCVTCPANDARRSGNSRRCECNDGSAHEREAEPGEARGERHFAERRDHQEGPCQHDARREQARTVRRQRFLSGSRYSEASQPAR